VSSFLQVSQHANEELFYTIIHDLTSRTSQEHQSSLNEKLDTTERFARNVSKEIQDPLSSINLAIDELASTLNSEDLLALADIIKSNCEQINGITSNVIESTSRLQLTLKSAKLSVIMTEIIESSELDYDIQIDYTSPEEEIFIDADSESLKRVIDILLQNSADAITSDKKIVKISVEKKGLKISDNGVGIEQEEIIRIFEPLVTSKSKAAGLGLTQAQRIVQAHNGRLTLSKKAEGGTLATVEIPLNTST
jgi:signal transduction histidine kinase